MKTILLFGAGKSSNYLIQYLLSKTYELSFNLLICDQDESLILKKINNHPNGKSIVIDIQDEDALPSIIKKADLILSLMPPALHYKIAIKCIEEGKNFVTASYCTNEIKELHTLAVNKNIAIVMEAGLDPGIDHMSILFETDKIKAQSGKITSLKSHTGGLIASESDDNPWHYKISWNPRNVVLAGQSGAHFLENNIEKYIPYYKIFDRYENLVINDREYESYANRDSISYKAVYDLNDVHTLIRGTLRNKGFCAGWQALVILGLTDDSFNIQKLKGTTYKDYLNRFLPDTPHQNMEKKISDYLRLSHEENDFIIKQLEFLGFFGDQVIELENGTPAQVLQEIIEKKLKLHDRDKDEIIMHHEIEYTMNEHNYILRSTFCCTGEDATNTAMAKTVGLPLGVITTGLITGELNLKGVVLPVLPNIYNYVLPELKKHNLHFETEVEKCL